MSGDAARGSRQVADIKAPGGEGQRVADHAPDHRDQGGDGEGLHAASPARSSCAPCRRRTAPGPGWSSSAPARWRSSSRRYRRSRSWAAPPPGRKAPGRPPAAHRCTRARPRTHSPCIARPRACVLFFPTVCRSERCERRLRRCGCARRGSTVEHEDLAVADLAGAGGPGDGLDDLVGETAGNTRPRSSPLAGSSRDTPHHGRSRSGPSGDRTLHLVHA